MSPGGLTLRLSDRLSRSAQACCSAARFHLWVDRNEARDQGLEEVHIPPAHGEYFLLFTADLEAVNLDANARRRHPRGAEPMETVGRVCSRWSPELRNSNVLNSNICLGLPFLQCNVPLSLHEVEQLGVVGSKRRPPNWIPSFVQRLLFELKSKGHAPPCRKEGAEVELEILAVQAFRRRFSRELGEEELSLSKLLLRLRNVGHCLPVRRFALAPLVHQTIE